MIPVWFRKKIGLLPIEGPISGGSGSLIPISVPSELDEVEKILDDLKDSRTYKGLVVNVNSPGGSPYRSKKIANKIEKLEIPTVARIENIAASGGYWIAASCDTIVADELSTIGSIGTISLRPDLTDLLKKIGIQVDIKSKGSFKDMGTPFSSPSKKEEKIRDQMLESINKKFTNYIMEKRGISKDSEVLEGKIYLGDEAIEVGLIDKIGGSEEAINFCEEVAGYSDLKIKDFRKELRKGPSIFDLIK